MIARSPKPTTAALIVATSLCPIALPAATIDLRARHLAPRPGYDPDGDKDFLFRMVSDQRFWIQSGMRKAEDEKRGFAALVKKEPAKYRCETPFKQVAHFGGQDFPFVLDATNLSSSGYDLLYFDRNGNGNLTDDGLVRALKPREGVRYSDGSARREFPRVLLKLESDGRKYDYAFLLSVYSRGAGKDDANLYVSVELQAATYRQGTVTIAGKRRQIVVLDNNSNGRFDDLWTVRDDATGPDNEIYPVHGDIVLVDPDTRYAGYFGYKAADNPERQYLSTLLNIDDAFHEVTVSPSGDKMTIEPSKAPLGAVQNPNGPYRAVLFGKQGLVKIGGQKDKPVPVPAGEWRLLEYQINLTRDVAKLLKSAGQSDKGSRGSSSSGPKLTVVSASASRDVKPVTVETGKTAALPFGPPYRPAVEVARYRTEEHSARLELRILGVAGEICTNLEVRGEEPAAPTFTIRTAKGETVQSGKFEWG